MTFTTLCGCVIISDNLGAYKIDYCPKHKAAPDMYEALKLFSGMESHIKRTTGSLNASDAFAYWYKEPIENLKKVLAKAGERCIP